MEEKDKKSKEEDIVNSDPLLSTNEVEIRDYEDRYVVYIIVKNVAKKNFQIRAERRRLFVRISNKSGSSKKTFNRSFQIPPNSDTKRVKTSFQKGKMIVTVPYTT